MTDDELNAIRARVQHDSPVWRMGSAEASMAGRYDTWSAMHCTEAGQAYEDRAELLAEVERWRSVETVWVDSLGEFLYRFD